MQGSFGSRDGAGDFLFGRIDAMLPVDVAL